MEKREEVKTQMGTDSELVEFFFREFYPLKETFL